ncbi:MAG: 50S ribosomal protein L3 [Candidatus Thorarchaeota archaeon]
MGHRKQSAPRHGSLSYRPRKRVRRVSGRIRYWPKDVSEPQILGFAGYKVGMTHVILIDDKPNSPWYGREISRAVSIVDTPPMLVASIRGYGQNGGKLRVLGETWAENLPRDIRRTMPWPKEYSAKASLNKLTKSLDEITELRVSLLTQPRQAGIGQKKPEVLEFGVYGGSIKDQFEYAKNLLGQEIRVRDVFQPGQYLDIVSVTKGKGFQGVIKRFGVSKLPHKSRKRVRAVGTLGPWHPSRIMYTVARAGQMGFHQRTEYNKRLLRIGEKSDDITPAGGFPHYGVLQSDFLLLDGSIPGVSRRLVRLRMPNRPKPLPEKPPEIVYVSTSSKK